MKTKLRSLAAVSIISIMTLVSVPTVSRAETGYTPSIWAAEKISICGEAGITPAGFDSMPYNESITRKDFFDLIINTCRLYGVKLPELPGAHPFTDTQEAAAEYAYMLGLTQGTAPGIFSPDQPLTREMAAVVLSRIRLLFDHTAGRGYEKTDRGGYVDDRGGYMDDRGGYMDERDGYMDDRGGYTSERGSSNDGRNSSDSENSTGNESSMDNEKGPSQETAIIYETQNGTLAYALPMDKQQADHLLDEYAADSADISEWAKANMADVYSLGLISGVGGGSLEPKGSITREQAAMMSLNVLAYNDEAKLRAIGVDECVIPAPAAIYISPSYTKNNVRLTWNDIPAAAAYDITVFNDGTPAYSTRSKGNHIDLSEGSPENLYGSIFGKESKSILTALQVVPVDSEGRPSIFSMKREFTIKTWRNLNELITGNPDRSQFSGIDEANRNMAGITVKVWNIDSSGAKVTASRTLKVNKNVADDVKKIFEEIYNGKEKFPIKSIGGYSYRDGKSQHSNGTAIDINPNENYFLLSNGRVSAGSFWKPGANPYSIKPGGDVVRAFNKYGWHWSPDMNWPNGKDYMHFSLLGK